MNIVSQEVLSQELSGKPRPMRRISLPRFIAGLLILLLCGAHARAQEESYVNMLLLIYQADAMSAKGDAVSAHAKYLQARKELQAIKQSYPNWGPKVVNYRWRYLAEKLAPANGESTASAARVSGGATESMSSARTPDVRLISAGAEPRKILRLHPNAGDKQSVSMTMKMGMAMEVAGNQVPAINIPALQLNMDLEVKDVSKDGEITYGITFGDATVAEDTNAAPMVADAMKSALSGLQELACSGKMTDQGISKSMEMKMPAGADAQLSQIMEQMKGSFATSSSPLPDEAVGPGARWEYKTKVKTQGMTIDQTADYELVSVQDGQINLKFTLNQNAANQKITNPAMPTVKVDLTKMTGSGNGASTLDLNRIMPSSGNLDLHTSIIMGMNMGQQKQSMNMQMDMNVKMESK